MGTEKMDEEEKWQELTKSILAAAKILGWDITEEDLPEPLNWKAGAKMHKELWNNVYAGRKKEWPSKVKL